MNPALRQFRRAADKLCLEVSSLRFSLPVTHVYNPLCYARSGYESYLEVALLPLPKRVLFLGMNPGPFGMVQSGVPFGDTQSVREWLRIHAKVSAPMAVHPKRPVYGLDCPRCEVSGRRLWGLFAAVFADPLKFFEGHFVLNYCPLAFVEESGRNRTPDKLPPDERRALFDACDRHLKAAADLLRPEWVVGIGRFAAKRAQEVLGTDMKIGELPHPSPASPTANRDWAGQAKSRLEQLGVWS